MVYGKAEDAGRLSPVKDDNASVRHFIRRTLPILDRVDYTPKHGSWLDMAEIEIGILCRQALAKPLPDFDSFQQQVRAWTIRRNSLSAKIHWQFTTGDARTKLARLYPSFL